MSIATIQSRVGEIQSMIAACNGQPPVQPPAQTNGTSFDQQLQSATGQLGVAASPAGASIGASFTSTPATSSCT